MYFPDLITKRLLLRKLTFDDTLPLYNHFNDPKVTKYLLDELPLTNLEKSRKLIEFFSEPENKTYNRWGIVRRSDNRLIGTCGFHKWEKSSFRSEIGYDLASDCWGQGYMSEALRAVINNGFTRMKLNRIDALVYVQNPRSYQLLQKLGFTQEGILRDYYYIKGSFCDHYLYALLHHEWTG